MRLGQTARVTAVLLGALALTGCGGGAEPQAAGTSASSGTSGTSGSSGGTGITPTGDPVVIEPLDAVPGADRYTVDGVGIDVPTSLTAAEQTLSDGSTQLQLREPGGERAAVILTITPQEGADRTAVDATSTLTETQLGASGAAADIVRAPARWEGMEYAVAITTAITVDGTAGEEVREALVVTLHDPDGTRVVGVSVEAAEDELEESDGYAALRTLRFDG